MRYIQIALCIILMIRIGGMIRRKTDIKRQSFWLWDSYVKIGIVFLPLYKKMFFNETEFLILYVLLLVHTYIYETKNNADIVFKISYSIMLLLLLFLSLSC